VRKAGPIPASDDTMFFWSTRFLFLLVALPLMFVRWQVAAVIIFALVVDLITLLGMTLPAFGIWGEFLLVFPTSLVLGLALSLGRQVSRIPMLVCVSALVVLHFSPYLDRVASGELRADVVLHRLPALGMLLFAVALGLELTYWGKRWLSNR
jgi:hypothetical protein